VTDKCFANFEVEEIEGCEQIEDEQGLHCGVIAGPARDRQREKSETADAADGNSSGSEIDTEEYTDDEGRTYDQGNTGRYFKSSGQHYESLCCHPILQTSLIRHVRYDGSNYFGHCLNIFVIALCTNFWFLSPLLLKVS